MSLFPEVEDALPEIFQALSPVSVTIKDKYEVRLETPRCKIDIHFERYEGTVSSVMLFPAASPNRVFHFLTLMILRNPSYSRPRQWLPGTLTPQERQHSQLQQVAMNLALYCSDLLQGETKKADEEDYEALDKY